MILFMEKRGHVFRKMLQAREYYSAQAGEPSPICGVSVEQTGQGQSQAERRGGLGARWQAGCHCSPLTSESVASAALLAWATSQCVPILSSSRFINPWAFNYCSINGLTPGFLSRQHMKTLFLNLKWTDLLGASKQTFIYSPKLVFKFWSYILLAWSVLHIALKNVIWKSSRAWWCIPLILVLRRQRQAQIWIQDQPGPMYHTEDNQGYTVRPYL